MIRTKLLIYPLIILMAVIAVTIPGAADAIYRRPTPQPVVTIPPPSATYPATQVTAVVTAIAHTPSMTPTVTAMWFECHGGVCPSLTPIQVTAVEITVLPPFMPMDGYFGMP